MPAKLLIIQVAGLSTAPNTPGLSFQPMQSVFPAVTCTAQASFRTAAPPSSHGMIANGLFHRSMARALFWEQSAGLVEGERIWRQFRQAGRTVGVMFWQQSLGEDADLVLSPAPIHKHHGGMIQDCYAKPAGLYQRLCETIGRPFKLQHYWGPFASAKAGDWIAEATAAVMADGSFAPDLLLTYLPTLDYDLQRVGHNHPRSAKAAQSLDAQVQRLITAAEANGYEVLIFGDYAIGPVSEAVLPNRALAEADLLATRQVGPMLYPDLYASRAFAMVDHEIAHVYVRDKKDLSAVRDVLAAQAGIADALGRDAQAACDVDHPNSGELLILAEPGKWLAYPWWADTSQAPDYAAHVDIHSKPGFDPCELFGEPFDWLPLSVTQDTARIRGSHGRVGQGRDVVWACTLTLPDQPADLISLARAARTWLNARS